MKITKQAIKNYKKNSDSKLEQAVCRIILNEIQDEPEMFFNDLFNHGCVSGMIGELVYYADTHKFATKYIEEIMELVEELESEAGEPLMDKDKGDKLNWLAWLGFEETARKIYQGVGGEDF